MGVFGINNDGTDAELFDRSWEVTVATNMDVTKILGKRSAGNDEGLRITDLDISFKVEKSTKDEPNKCELTIYNLNEDQRASIEELNPPTKPVSVLDKAKVKEAARRVATIGIPCKIEAGYGGNNSLIWLGDLRTAHSIRKGPDWVTIIESGDGEKAFQNARMNVSYGPKTPADVALRAAARAMGIAEGNLSSAVAKMKKAGLAMPQGNVFSGPVRDIIRDVCRGADLEWSIQDGALQFIERGAALDMKAIKISPKTGMLDSPTVDVDGILKVKTLMVPDVRPGRLIVVESARINGGYKIEKCEWVGDSAGSDWYIEIEAQRY